MKVESVANADATGQSLRPFPEGFRVTNAKVFIKNQHKYSKVSLKSEPEENKLLTTEILDKIREISKDGLYSVRFEKSDQINELIIKVVDRNTDEVILQIPPEEILGMRAKMLEIKGNIVRSEG